MRVLSLSEEQILQYKILQYIDKIAKNEGIDYFLAAGSCLGAVRERGFISWDDDIDIWMKRKDYEKFLAVIDKYHNDLFFVQNCEADNSFFIPGITRICINGTDKWGENCKSLSFHKGIYFDIFPLDNVSSCVQMINIKRRLLAMIRVLIGIKIGGAELVNTRKFFWLIPLACLLSKNVLLKLYRLIAVTKRDKGFLIYYPSQYSTERIVFKEKWFEDKIYLQFVDGKYPCANGYEDILNTMYGADYMTPRVTKGSIHHAWLVEDEIMERMND